ncbi:MAG: hypothetical protein Unbinned3818contig1000_59 [Prokaryotic dsDNA virus sp.]|nr:hypothetical protein [Phycisphaerae bacterium]QDP45988.1 MAG: hypothetical protein Unbinned3818contig1000_59 [Prokaryotic dsDNA virus sp.]
MSADYKFSGNNFDISFTGNDVDFSSSGAEVSQNSQIRLQMIAGEQFDDTRVGMPWLTTMVDPQVSLSSKEQIIRKTILSTPNVRSLDSLKVSVETTEGRAIADFAGTTESNEFFGGSI